MLGPPFITERTAGRAGWHHLRRYWVAYMRCFSVLACLPGVHYLTGWVHYLGTGHRWVCILPG